MRRRLLPISAILSALLLACVVAQWAGWVDRPACVGSNRVVEATANGVVVDDETVQFGRGGLWVGRCRVAVVAPFGLPDPERTRDRFLEVTRHINVFSLDDLSPQLSGLGRQRGSVLEPVGTGFLGYELDGYLVPHWVLVPVAAVLPAVWIVRRLRRARGSWRGGR
jgi:hypothetical protein